jgi:hypothetical protein
MSDAQTTPPLTTVAPTSVHSAASAQAPLHLTIVLAVASTGGARLGVQIALETEVLELEFFVALDKKVIGRLARHKPALGLVVQHRDELGPVVGFAAQRLVRDDDRGSRQCGRRDAIEHARLVPWTKGWIASTAGSWSATLHWLEAHPGTANWLQAVCSQRAAVISLNVSMPENLALLLRGLERVTCHSRH